VVFEGGKEKEETEVLRECEREWRWVGPIGGAPLPSLKFSNCKTESEKREKGGKQISTRFLAAASSLSVSKCIIENKEWEPRTGSG